MGAKYCQSATMSDVKKLKVGQALQNGLKKEEHARSISGQGGSFPLWGTRPQPSLAATNNSFLKLLGLGKTGIF